MLSDIQRGDTFVAAVASPGEQRRLKLMLHMCPMLCMYDETSDEHAEDKPGMVICWLQVCLWVQMTWQTSAQ